MNYIFLLLGLLTLIVGGEFLVKGGIGIAKKFSLSSLVIGMTVISFGTSAPELIVSVQAALSGNPEIVLGNVIGSNMANIALVLGITIMIFPIIVDRNSKVLDWPVMMLASILFYAFAYDGILSRLEGGILFTMLIVFTIHLIRSSRKASKLEIEEFEELVHEHVEEDKPNIAKSVGFLLLGLVGLYFGATWLLEGAVNIATDFGMEQRVIGITIIAFGTSVPELVTSGVAAYRKETDIALGNLIGSNVFNIMSVIGITAMVRPIEVGESILNYDMIWMLCVSILLLPLMLIGKKMGKLKGVMLLSTYVIYIITLLIAI